MKLKLSIFTVFVFFLSQTSFAKLRIPIPYGSEEKIIKIQDFPDTELFQLEDGTYFDLGSKYIKSHFLWLSYSNTEPILVGYIDGQDSYLELTPEILAEISKVPDITLPEEGSISFFDKIIGKLLLGILAIAVLFGLYSKYIKKETD